MNESDNIALVQRAFGSFGRGDIQGILDLVTEDTDWVMPGPAIIPHAGTRKGPGEIREFFDLLMSTQSDQSLVIDQYVAQDNTVVALGRYTATITTTGKQLKTPAVFVFQIRNGKFARQEIYTDTAAGAESYTPAAAAATS